MVILVHARHSTSPQCDSLLVRWVRIYKELYGLSEIRVAFQLGMHLEGDKNQLQYYRIP